MELAPTLRLALTLASERGVTSSALAVAAGISISTAATFLVRYTERGLLEIVDGDGVRNDPRVYAATAPGAYRLAHFHQPRRRRRKLDFGPLLEILGIGLTANGRRNAPSRLMGLRS